MDGRAQCTSDSCPCCVVHRVDRSLVSCCGLRGGQRFEVTCSHVENRDRSFVVNNGRARERRIRAATPLCDVFCSHDGDPEISAAEPRQNRMEACCLRRREIPPLRSPVTSSPVSARAFRSSSFEPLEVYCVGFDPVLGSD